MPRWVRLRVGIRVMFAPNSSTDPLSGVISPVMRLNKVVLPAPFGPMISRRSPGADIETDVRGDAQAAERLAEVGDDERARGFRVHGFRSASAAALPRRVTLRQAERVNRAAPGTRPSGMNTTMATKMAPSMKFQRVM